MKIRSDIVGTTTPRANWNQSDPKKADYIIGRDAVYAAINAAQETANSGVTDAKKAQFTANNAQTAADNAQATADNAQTAADNAQASADNAHNAAVAAEKNAKDYADSLHFVTKVRIPYVAWPEHGPCTVAVGAEGILAGDTPHYSVVYSNDQATRLLEKEAFAMIDDLETDKDELIFTCFEETPKVTLHIQVEVNR